MGAYFMLGGLFVVATIMVFAALQAVDERNMLRAEVARLTRIIKELGGTV